MFTINLNDGGNGDQPPPSDGAAKMPDWGRHLAQMAQSLSAIQKSVASIQATAQQILGSLNRTGGVASTSASAPASRGAKKDAINVQRIFHVDPRKAIVPMRNVADWGSAAGFPNWARVAEEISRPPDVARISSITSQVGGMVDGEAVEREVRKATSGQPRSNKVAPPPKPGKGPRPRRTPSFLGAGRFVSSMLYAVNNTALAGTMIGTAAAAIAPPLAVVTGGVLAYQIMNNMGERAMRHSAGFSPAVAGLQAQVDVSRLMTSVAVANSPITVAAARFKRDAELSMQDVNTGIGIITGAGSMSISSAAKLGWSYVSPLGLGLRIIGHIANEKLRKYMESGGFNSLFEKDIDAMVGGMLSMQDSMKVDGIKGNRSINTWDRGTWFSKKKWVQKGRVR